MAYILTRLNIIKISLDSKILENLDINQKIIGIGETGLDFIIIILKVLIKLSYSMSI